MIITNVVRLKARIWIMLLTLICVLALNKCKARLRFINYMLPDFQRNLRSVIKESM